MLKILKTKKPKKPTLSKLKKDAWKVFSIWIRNRDLLPSGNAICVTCGVIKPWKEMQAGHYCSRRHSATLFREDNVHTQCVGCNMFSQGNIPSYVLFLQRRYGPLKPEELYRDSQKVKKWTVWELEALIEHYSDPKRPPQDV